MGVALAYRLARSTRPLLVLAATAATCACAGPPQLNLLAPPAIDAASPVAKEVRQASSTGGAYPRFSDIPQPPRDVRPVRAWSRSIYDTLRLRRLLIVEAALAGPTPTDTDAFAKRLRDAAAGPASPSAVAASQLNQQTGAFVQGARRRATPPSSAR